MDTLSPPKRGEGRLILVRFNWVIAMSPVKAKLLRRLKKILPGEIVLAPATLASYAGDKWFASHQPDAVALPAPPNPSQRFCASRISMEYPSPARRRPRLRRRLRARARRHRPVARTHEPHLGINAGDFVAVVQPGANTEKLQAAVEKRGLFYPPDPASRADNFIGGNIATNAGGRTASKTVSPAIMFSASKSCSPTARVVPAGQPHAQKQNRLRPPPPFRRFRRPARRHHRSHAQIDSAPPFRANWPWVSVP